jgi:nicotinamidase-related amidase
MKNKTVLVVVDMQEYFDAANNEKTLKEVKKQIQLAKKRNGPIIFLEYAESGKTKKELLDLVKNYKHKYIETKYNDSGADKIIRVIKRGKLGEKNIRICGVNSDCCVLETTKDLITRLPKSKINVIKKACNTYNKVKGWFYYPKKIKNLILIS